MVCRLVVIACCPLFAMLWLFTGCQLTSPVPEYPERLPDIVDFNLHIKPILSDRCFKCHGPDENSRKAGLRLDDEEHALRKNLENGGHAFVPGKPNKSMAYQRIISSDPEWIMPPSDSRLTLSPYEVGLIERWIDQGAKYQKHWSFITPEVPEVPEVNNRDWPSNEVDQFILAKLESKGLQPNEAADREILLRRLFLDITGLPPGLIEMQAFLANQDQNAVEKMVDHLLQSPHFGERMALDWMDVARYADSHGYSQDGSRIMYPWRDWVIKAFNENMPFDQFITWQIAGDLLPGATQDQKLATAFLRNHRINAEGGIIPEEYRVEYVADRSHTTSTAFLGLTMECARCHDHKYDPISQEEYYQFFSFFNQNNEEGQGTPDGNTGPEIYLSDEEVVAQKRFIDQKIEALENKLEERSSELRNRFVNEQTPENLVSKIFEKSRLRSSLITHLDFENAVVKQRTGQRSQTLIDDDVLNRSYSIRGEGITVPGIKGTALKAGAYDGMTISPDLINFKRSDAFSFSFWLQAHPETGFMEIIHRMGTKYARQNGYDLVLKNGHLSFRIAHSLPFNLIEVQLEEKLDPQKWAHIAITYDGSAKAAGVQFYLNGHRAASKVLYDQLERYIVHKDPLTVGGTMHLEEQIDDGYFLIDELRIYGLELSSLEVANIYNGATSSDLPEVMADHQLLSDQTYHLLQDSLQYYRKTGNEIEDRFLGVMVMQDLPNPRPTYVLDRGQYDAPVKKVTVGTPVDLLPFSTSLPANRLGLARWLVDPQNPLTARVIVNRVWQQFFGRGIVSTAEDFGNQGDLPTHPELLDWLATSFIQSGWDLKQLIKRIVLSATYQQSSMVSLEERQEDPDNRLLARGPSFRMPAEFLRDNALAAAGLLTVKVGGASVKPYQPDGLWEEKTSFTKDLATYQQDHGPDLYRRSLYTFWRRTSNHPVMAMFDAPTRDNCSVRRQVSNTPLQALALMNEVQFVEASRVLSDLVMKKEKTLPEQIKLAYRLLSGCHPPATVVTKLAELWQEEQINFAVNPDEAKKLLSIGEYPLDAGINMVEQAALTIVCNTIMNFDEVVTRR